MIITKHQDEASTKISSYKLNLETYFIFKQREESVVSSLGNKKDDEIKQDNLKKREKAYLVNSL